MLNVSNSKYITVFKPEINLDKSENMVCATLSSSKKVKDREGNVGYQHMTWYGHFVGDAFEPAKALRSKDVIDIIKGIITNRYDKEKHCLYVDVYVYEFAMSDLKKHDSKQEGEQSAIGPDNAHTGKESGNGIVDEAG